MARCFPGSRSDSLQALDDSVRDETNEMHLS